MPTLKGLWRCLIPSAEKLGPQPFQGWVYARVHTQGSSFLATLGWRTQSLRDWNACKVQGPVRTLKPSESFRNVDDISTIQLEGFILVTAQDTL